MQLQSKAVRSALAVFISVSLFICGFTVSVAQEKITTPEKHFGFKPGADKKLVRWDNLVKYFYQVEKESGRLKVMNMGPSTQGNPDCQVFPRKIGWSSCACPRA